MALSNSPDLRPHLTPLPDFGLRTSDFGLWTYLDHNATTPVLPEVPQVILHSSSMGSNRRRALFLTRPTYG